MSTLFAESETPIVADPTPAPPARTPPKPKRKQGRYGHKGVYVRIAPILLGKIDAWMKIRSIESRPEAIREILEMNISQLNQTLSAKPKPLAK